jgi:hypothetical protein
MWLSVLPMMNDEYDDGDNDRKIVGMFDVNVDKGEMIAVCNIYPLDEDYNRLEMTPMSGVFKMTEDGSKATNIVPLEWNEFPGTYSLIGLDVETVFGVMRVQFSEPRRVVSNTNMVIRAGNIVIDR